MKIFTDHQSLGLYVTEQKINNKTIGFAPTMGALHLGHLSLCEAARTQNDVVIVSIFVNPTQFNNAEDLQRYPRNVSADIEFLKASHFVDAVYLPEIKDLYPDTMSSGSYTFDGLENEMEGASRPGHFNGVATVVEKLFSQVLPDRAYFGEKDYQQLAIIRKLAAQKNMNITIVGVPVYREQSGLAMSSRNERLSADAREKAKIIHGTLVKTEEWFRLITIPEIYRRVAAIFKERDDMELEYVTIADEESLKETDFFYKDRSYRAFIVVKVEGIRLIDNIHLT